MRGKLSYVGEGRGRGLPVESPEWARTESGARNGVRRLLDMHEAKRRGAAVPHEAS
jgi:hypothetical protein